MSTGDLKTVAAKFRALEGQLSAIIKNLESNDKLIEDTNKLVLEAQIDLDNNRVNKTNSRMSLIALNLQKITKTYSIIGVLHQMARGRPQLELDLYNSEQSFEDMFKGPGES